MARFAVARRAAPEDRTITGGSEDRRWIATCSLAAVVLAVWHLLVWGGRLRNLLAEPGGLGDLTGSDRWSLAGSLLFGMLGLATIVAFVVDRRPDGVVRIPASALAMLGIAVWSYRAVVILGRDYAPGFLVVHTVLAVVSIGLGLWYLGLMLRERTYEVVGERVAGERVAGERLTGE